MSYFFESTLRRFDSKLWGHHFVVPKIYSDEIKTLKIKRLVCTVNSKVNFQCALMPSGNGEYFINVNKQNRKELKWRIGQSMTIELKPDTTKYGMDMPEELEVLLESDEYGNSVFHELTPGKQRNLIYIAGKPKQSSTRLKKSIIIIDYLKEVNGKLDFKELNQAFKDRKDEVFE